MIYHHSFIYGDRLWATTTFQSPYPESKVHGANMGPTWVLSAPDGPHFGPMNLVIRVAAKGNFPYEYDKPLHWIIFSACNSRLILRVSCQKGPYLPCVSMAGRALLAGYHRYDDRWTCMCNFVTLCLGVDLLLDWSISVRFPSMVEQGIRQWKEMLHIDWKHVQL